MTALLDHKLYDEPRPFSEPMPFFVRHETKLPERRRFTIGDVLRAFELLDDFRENPRPSSGADACEYDNSNLKDLRLPSCLVGSIVWLLDRDYFDRNCAAVVVDQLRDIDTIFTPGAIRLLAMAQTYADGRAPSYYVLSDGSEDRKAWGEAMFLGAAQALSFYEER